MRYKTEEETEKDEEIEKVIHQHTRVFNDVQKTLDMTKRICTDQKCNRRVVMPQARPVKEECCLRTRKEAWKNAWHKYVKEETKGKGSQDHHQLDSTELSGRTSLMKRVAAGELIIGPSDKGKKIVIMDMETYYEMSSVHTTQDQEVDWKKLQDTQREIRAHSRALAKIFQLGH